MQIKVDEITKITDFSFKVAFIRITFENSLIKNFLSDITLRFHRLFKEVPKIATLSDGTQSINSIDLSGALQQIDGIPTQNWIYGGPAISITPEAVQQLDYIKGGMEPQYGNALSGVVNIATRDGGTNLAGSLRFQTSEVGGALGNDPDDLLNYSLFDGYLSGPIPGFSNKLRFMFAGRQQRSADAVYEFDNDVRDPSCTQNTNPESCSGNPSPFLGANFMDVYGGWRAFGAANLRELSGKLTYFFRPTMKLGVSYLTRRAPDITPEAVEHVTVRMFINSAKARRELGYEPVPLEKMLADTYQWMKSEGLLPS